MVKKLLEEGVMETLLTAMAIQGVKEEPEEIPEDKMLEILELYTQVSQVFMDNKTDMWTAFKVVTAMGEAMSQYIAAMPSFNKPFPSGKETQ